jgi:chromosome partitioning protein
MSALVQSSVVDRPQGKCRVVILTAAKGGVGKTTISRALLVAAANSGLRVAGVDTDLQGSLSSWARSRDETIKEVPTLAKLQVWSEHPDQWRVAVEKLKFYDFAVIDTPPGVGPFQPAIEMLIRIADYVIVPTGTTGDDLKQTLNWFNSISPLASRISFCLSAVEENTRSYRSAVPTLNKTGNVLAMPIPRLQIIPDSVELGLTVLDRDELSVTSKERSGLGRARDALSSVWDTVRREVKL